MIRAFHDPYDTFFRFPSGARPAGSVVCLRLKAFDAPKTVQVRLWSKNGEQKLNMNYVSEGLFEININTGDIPGVIWYYFVLTDALDGISYVGKPIGDVSGVFEQEPTSFQLTVYDPAFDTPSWMKKSVMLQILTDRFCPGAGGKIAPHGAGTYLHTNWFDLPDLKPDGEDEESTDFFGGSLDGIREKLGFIKDMGFGAIYLNPIFEARSNHKYDTGDYKKVDASFGGDRALEELINEAAKKDIHIVLDGVFSHTGADSRYFDINGVYGNGAYKNPASPYAPWYRFKTGFDDYDCWWGVKSLPNVNETEPSYMNYIIGDGDSVVARYIKKGTSGWRLDVADELPMEFIRALRRRVKAENPEACVIGEVWEDITNKTAYGETRCYAAGDTLDSAMNYPLRDAVIAFFTGKINAYTFAEFLNFQQSSLPRPMLMSMMNLLGSHDKPRIINVLAEQEGLEPPRGQRKFVPLTGEQYEKGKRRFINAFSLICALPGMPCLYYGDDAGLTGMTDPFCRLTYPWGREDVGLRDEIRRIIKRRNETPSLTMGECVIRAKDASTVQIMRDGTPFEFSASEK